MTTPTAIDGLYSDRDKLEYLLSVDPTSYEKTVYLDSFTGSSDDDLMDQALTQVVTAANGTIALSARAYSFARPWVTSFKNASTLHNIRILGQGAGSAGGVVYPGTGATTVNFTYSGSGALMDFEHVGKLEIAHICFNSTALNPFLFSSNPTAEIHHNVFNGGVGTRGTCMTDAIVFGGPGFYQNGFSGQTSGFFGYGSKVHHNYFHNLRYIATFGGGCNAVNVENNIIDQTCGNPANWGSAFLFNGGGNGAASTVDTPSNGGEISQVASWAYPSPGVLAVASTAGFSAPGSFQVATSTTSGYVTYTGISGNTFTGCIYGSGSATGTVSTGGALTTAIPGNSANIIRHNYVECTYYKALCTTNGAAQANANVIGPNCLQDVAQFTGAVWDPTCSQNWVDDTSQRADRTAPPWIDFAPALSGNGGISTQGGLNASTVFNQHVSMRGANLVARNLGVGPMTENAYGDRAYVSAIHNSSTNNTPGLQFNSVTCKQVADGQIYSGSNIVTSATAAFAQNDIGVYIYSVTGIPLWSYIAWIVTPASVNYLWTASSAYALGALAVPLNGHLYQATTGGTSAGTIPVWPLAGGTVSDGSVVWKDLGTATAAILQFNCTATASGVTVSFARGTTTQAMLTVMNNHIMGSGSAPAYAVQTAGGAGSTATVAGNDMAHVVTYTAAGTPTTGLILIGTPATSFSGSVPGASYSITPQNANAVGLGLYGTMASYRWNISAVTAPTAGQIYIFGVNTVG